jgi:hypothetical protein
MMANISNHLRHFIENIVACRKEAGKGINKEKGAVMKHLRSIAAAICLMSLVIAGGALGAQEYASMNVTPGDIVWHPQVSSGGVSLTVTGPDDVYISRAYAADASPSIGLEDSAGSHLPDGQYSYELRFTPVTGTVTRSDSKPYAPPSGIEPMVQSGSFRIVDGKFLVPSTDGEGPAAQVQPLADSGIITPMDQVVADDMIVQGSLCVGFDCVNNESFGFDTIRLKENNTRIKFEDTSVGAFPTTDWQLTANDSASGGANQFSIEDITGAKVPFKILAGAPNNSLFVNSSGKVGLRTATPVLDLHINTGDTPAIRLEQNSSVGFSAQTWDVAGNEANFFVRDVTGGSRLPFRIRPGAPTSSIDISAAGNVGIGTDSPAYLLDVNGEARIKGIVYVSSRNSKDNIADLKSSEAMEALNRLNPVKYNYKTDKTERHVGFIAEDVPDLVAKNARTGIDPMDIVAVLTKVVQEQNKTIDNQQKAIEELKGELSSLKKIVGRPGAGNMIMATFPGRVY